MPHSMSPLVHIGMPKTATKTLQWRLFAEHSEVFYLGRFDGPHFGGRYGRFGACRDAEVFGIMDAIAYSGFAAADTGALRSRLEGYLGRENTSGRIPVWSWESYCTDSFENRRKRAQNLRDVWQEARILVTVRHPVGLLESAYLQQLKRDNVGAHYKRGKAPFYKPIDDWVAANANGDVDDHLDYANTIRLYSDYFGIENVCVLVFEELKTDKVAFFRRLCSFMGINLDEALALVEDNVDNSRWTEQQFSRLREIHASPLRALRFRFAEKPQRRRLLALTDAGDPVNPGVSAPVRIGDALRRMILEQTRDGNRWLEENFAIDLKQYGYLSD